MNRIQCSRCPVRGFPPDSGHRPQVLIVDGLCWACWIEECEAEFVESLLP